MSERCRVRGDLIKEDEIAFSYYEGAIKDAHQIVFAPPSHEGVKVCERNRQGWVREPDHIVFCDNGGGYFHRLNRQDALDLAVWLARTASTMED